MANITFNIASLAASASGAVLAVLALARALPWWLALFPKLQVLKPVVSAVAVYVVNVFVVIQGAAKVAGHHKPVFKHRIAFAGPTSAQVVFGRVEQCRHVSLFAYMPTLLCERVRCASAGSSIGRLVPVVSQQVCNLVRIGAELLGNLIAGKAGAVQAKNVGNRDRQGRTPAAYVSDGHAICDQDAPSGFVVIAPRTAKSGNPFACDVSLANLGGNFLGHFALRWHAPMLANNG
jgi:hypothetical protein